MKTQPYYSVRTSKIHGRGVFARRPIRKGIRVIEYTGPIISTKEADKMADKKDSSGHLHTMLFTVDKDRVIDGTKGGDARYINHSCSPNCEAVQDGDQIFIEALRSIKKGEEITYDYFLQVEGKITEKVKKEYACFCGSPKCRGTQIAPEILEAQAKKDAKKAARAEAKRLKKEMKKAKKAEAKAKAKAEKKAKAVAKAKAKAEAKAKKSREKKAKAAAEKAKKEKDKKAKDAARTKDKKSKKEKNGAGAEAKTKTKAKDVGTAVKTEKKGKKKK